MGRWIAPHDPGKVTNAERQQHGIADTDQAPSMLPWRPQHCLRDPVANRQRQDIMWIPFRVTGHGVLKHMLHKGGFSTTSKRIFESVHGDVPALTGDDEVHVLTNVFGHEDPLIGCRLHILQRVMANVSELTKVILLDRTEEVVDNYPWAPHLRQHVCLQALWQQLQDLLARTCSSVHRLLPVYVPLDSHGEAQRDAVNAEVGADGPFHARALFAKALQLHHDIGEATHEAGEEDEREDDGHDGVHALDETPAAAHSRVDLACPLKLRDRPVHGRQVPVPDVGVVVHLNPTAWKIPANGIPDAGIQVVQDDHHRHELHDPHGEEQGRGVHRGEGLL
mmetsp:Transcript_126703/g.370233  ORF Transcript_126703/g.370233 Transcript_126703/m.370233 type:complete len:336 (-) Transcript_126703:1508-2515(-)